MGRRSLIVLFAVAFFLFSTSGFAQKISSNTVSHPVRTNLAKTANLGSPNLTRANMNLGRAGMAKPSLGLGVERKLSTKGLNGINSIGPAKINNFRTAAKTTGPANNVVKAAPSVATLQKAGVRFSSRAATSAGIKAAPLRAASFKAPKAAALEKAGVKFRNGSANTEALKAQDVAVLRNAGVKFSNTSAKPAGLRATPLKAQALNIPTANTLQKAGVQFKNTSASSGFKAPSINTLQNLGVKFQAKK